MIADLAVFRGFTAAASLKRRMRDIRLERLRGFPRLHRRGLIEAGLCIQYSGSTSRFPRLHRRGLIEARRAAQARQWARRCFPRLHRRGLIEAQQTNATVSQDFPISAASPPRPH